MKTGFLPAVIVLLWTAFSQQADAATLVARATGNIAGSVFQLDINQKTLDPDAKFPWTIEIQCIQACKNFAPFRDEVAEAPISAFRLWDGSDQFITISVSGTSYWIRIYRVGSDGNIKKLLETVSRTIPSFIRLPDRKDGVVVTNPNTGADPQDVTTNGVLWISEGKEYHLAGTQH